MNPLDWTLPPFLTLYILLMISMSYVGFALRSNTGRAVEAADALTPPEVAFLAGSGARLGDVILFHLVSTGAAAIRRGRMINVSNQAPIASISGFTQTPAFQLDMTRAQFQDAIKPHVDYVEDRLIKLGYLSNGRRLFLFRLSMLPIVLGLMVLGSAKAASADPKGDGSGVLISLVLLTALIGASLMRCPIRTRQGHIVLQSYETAAGRLSQAPSIDELTMAVALSGPDVLSGGPYASVYLASKGWQEELQTASS